MTSRVRFGFVVHPITGWQTHFLGVRTLQPALALSGPRASDRASIARVARFPSIESVAGARTGGTVWAVPRPADALIADQAQAVDDITAAVQRAADDGAEVVGLGAVCAVVGLRGEEVARQATVPVTTGVSFTAYAAVETLRVSLEKLGETLPESQVVIAGLPGALAQGVAQLLAAQGARVVLAGGPARVRDRLAESLPVATSVAEVGAACADASIVVGASSTGGALRADELRPGTLVIDVAEPRDLPPSARSRADLVIVEGENVTLPTAQLPVLTRIYNRLVGHRAGTIYACFAEPMVLALEGRAESFSLGKTIDPERAAEIGRLGARHGFRVGPLISGGRVISPARWRALAGLRGDPSRSAP